MQKIKNLHSWINELPDDLKAKMLACAQTKHYADGEAIYSLGEPAKACFMIQTGQVRICNFTFSGKVIQMASLYEGDCFGEMGLIDELPRFNHTYAVGDTVLLSISGGDFQRLYRDYVDIAYALNVYLCRRIHSLYVSAEDACVLTLRERLLRLIARLGFSRGIEKGGAVFIENVSHETLANMLGATRQGVSRELKAMEGADLLKLQYGKIAIHDLSKVVNACDRILGATDIVPDYRP